MHRVIAGGTGLVGKALVTHWLRENYRVTVVGRDKQKIVASFGNQVRALEWLELSAEELQGADLVVNLAGAGIADKRWTKERKQEIVSSRVDTTRLIVSILSTMGSEAPALFNASAIGVYGLQPRAEEGLPKQLDEDTPLNWDEAPDFLAYVGREWEKATWPATRKGVRVVNLRFGVVLSNQGGALPKMVKPFYFYLGGRIGSGQQPISWVALNDVIRAIDFLSTQKQITGPINIVAPGCVTQNQFADTVAKVLKKPTWVTLPAYLVQLIFGEMGKELLLEGQRVYPKHLLSEDFEFLFNDIKPALTKYLWDKSG